MRPSASTPTCASSTRRRGSVSRSSSRNWWCGPGASPRAAETSRRLELIDGWAAVRGAHRGEVDEDLPDSRVGVEEGHRRYSLVLSLRYLPDAFDVERI